MLLESQVLMESQGIPDTEDRMGNQGVKGKSEHPDRQDDQEKMENRVFRDEMARKDTEHPEGWVESVIPARRDRPDWMESQEELDFRDLLDQKENQDIREVQVLEDHQESQDCPEDRVQTPATVSVLTAETSTVIRIRTVPRHDFTNNKLFDNKHLLFALFVFSRFLRLLVRIFSLIIFSPG